MNIIKERLIQELKDEIKKCENILDKSEINKPMRFSEVMFIDSTKKSLDDAKSKLSNVLTWKDDIEDDPKFYRDYLIDILHGMLLNRLYYINPYWRIEYNDYLRKKELDYGKKCKTDLERFNYIDSLIDELISFEKENINVDIYKNEKLLSQYLEIGEKIDINFSSFLDDIKNGDIHNDNTIEINDDLVNSIYAKIKYAFSIS